MCAVILLGVLLGGAAGAGAAGQGELAPVAGPDEIFARIGAAWQSNDEQALANLVHPDGLRVRGGRGNERVVPYSPSQAFYYFKNLFQTNPTVSFTFERRQQAAGGQRTRAMAVWTHDVGNSSRSREAKLVLVLSSDKGLWRLSEIQTISTK